MEDNKSFKWIYEITNYKAMIRFSIVINLLFLLTMGSIYFVTTQILKEQRIYKKDSEIEKKWRNKTQHNLNRPREKKINL
jgi:hypothetical protein